MTTWRRWQDWVVVGLGVVLFVTPFVFGFTAAGAALAWSAWIVATLVVLAVGSVRLMGPRPRDGMT
jgi:hypothetical protein